MIAFVPEPMRLAAVEAVYNGEKNVREMVENYDRNCKLIVSGLNMINDFFCLLPKGAFYVFPNISGFGKSSVETAEYILEKTHVVTSQGSAFGPHGEGYIRMCYASTYEDIKIGLQVWPKTFMASSACTVALEEAEAVVTEYEGEIGTEPLVINAKGKNVRTPKITPPKFSSVFYAAAFKKTGEGLYEEGSLIDLTAEVKTTEHDARDELTVVIDRPDLEGYTVYVMVGHYHDSGDVFSEFNNREYKKLMDAYSSIPFDGFGLDEFKHIMISNPLACDMLWRERLYSQCFAAAFAEQKGSDLIKTMFEMRFCPEGRTDIRMRAINDYWDVLRPSTLKVEDFVADYAKKTFGEDTFIGVHNTFHNMLQIDELWATGCNWWDIPRLYAQTDEDIPYPVRAGMSLACPESIVYDMFYHKDENVFFEKAVRDARYNSRIHYHAMNDGFYGVNTGSEDFLGKIGKIESKINLLNMFDTKQPEMELLVMFGFPALCNWYPDYSARNNCDVNGKLNIMQRTNKLWSEGYFNALVPSNGVEKGRAKIEDGKIDYCGHKFSKLLFLYPEYSKPEVAEFVEKAVGEGVEVKIIGDYTHGFDGKPEGFSFGKEYFLAEGADIVAAMSLKQNTIKCGCITEDGAVVISDYDSVMNDGFCTYEFELENYKFETEFRGTFALKLDADGNVEKLVAGNLKYLKKNGETLLELDGEKDYMNI